MNEVTRKLQEGKSVAEITREITDRAFSNDTIGVPDSDMWVEIDGKREYHPHWASMYINLYTAYEALVQEYENQWNA